MQLLFKNSFGMDLDVPSVVREVAGYIRSNPTASYKVIIGTDSARLPTNDADFVTAVVVYRVGNGGRYFYRRFEIGKFHTLRDRIIQEVLFSIEAAKEVLEELKKDATLPNWSFEIHADVGENGNTKVLIQEVVGMIRANNFEVKTKPESYAASKVADKYC